MIQNAISRLVQYGLATGLIEKGDGIYTANRLLELLRMDTLEEETEAAIRGFDPADQSVWARSAITPMRQVSWKKIQWDTGICLTQR